MNNFIDYKSHAETLFDNGFFPIPIVPEEKRPAIKNWTGLDKLNRQQYECYFNHYDGHGIGILLGKVCAIDVDIMNSELSYKIIELVKDKIGHAPMRIGQSPKAALFFRVEGKTFRKLSTESYINGNPYGIDTSVIFIGGYSAGGVIAIHHAYIDNKQELPQNILSRLSSIGGTLDGDAGNFGFSSKINGVINFAGGIHDLGWINSAEEPIVSVHGDLDLVVNYNCSPALNNPALLNLCGSNEIHIKANNQCLNNQLLELNFTNHEWAQFGTVNPKFVQGLEFSRDFVYNLLPCNQSLSIDNNFTDLFVISYV